MHGSLSGLYFFAKFCFVNMLVCTVWCRIQYIERRLSATEVITADSDASCHVDSAVCLNVKALRILETLEIAENLSGWVGELGYTGISQVCAPAVLLRDWLLIICNSAKKTQKDLRIAFGWLYFIKQHKPELKIAWSKKKKETSAPFRLLIKERQAA